MFTSTPPICTGRALELSRKDSNIRYLRHLGNSDIAEKIAGVYPCIAEAASPCTSDGTSTLSQHKPSAISASISALDKAVPCAGEVPNQQVDLTHQSYGALVIRNPKPYGVCLGAGICLGHGRCRRWIARAVTKFPEISNRVTIGISYARRSELKVGCGGQSNPSRTDRETASHGRAVETLKRCRATSVAVHRNAAVVAV